MSTSNMTELITPMLSGDDTLTPQDVLIVLENCPGYVGTYWLYYHDGMEYCLFKDDESLICDIRSVLGSEVMSEIEGSGTRGLLVSKLENFYSFTDNTVGTLVNILGLQE